MGNVRREKIVYRLLNYRSQHKPNLIPKTYKQVFFSSYYFHIDIISWQKPKLAKFNWIE